MQDQKKRRFKKPLNGQAFATIYIGNLLFSKSEGAIKKLFSPFGKVINVKVVIDPATQKGKGIAFVQMTNIDDAKEAIRSLNEKKVDGRTLKVSIAQERNETPIAKTVRKPKEAKDKDIAKNKKVKKKKVRGLDILLDYLGK